MTKSPETDIPVVKQIIRRHVRGQEEESLVEKILSLSFEEATALLEMSLFSYIGDVGEEAESALVKLGDLWREFSAEQNDSKEINIAHKLARAA